MRKICLRRAIVLGALIGMAACNATPSTPTPQFMVVVNNNGDTDLSACTYSQPSCSLREAINKANHSEGTVVIRFDIDPGPAAVPVVIRPASPLPEITNTVILDGTTQTGYAGSPMVEVDGGLAGASSGLVVRGDGGSVKGLAINRFAYHGIDIQAQDVSIIGNYIGTDVSGTADEGNGLWGINLTCGTAQPKRVLIGGPGSANRNVISGNNAGGIRIDAGECGAFESSAWIRSNYIGTNAAGDAALGNSGPGIRILGASLNMVGGLGNEAGNVISGNSGDGVQISGNDSSQNTVRGNTIGTNAAGDSALGNSGDGIYNEGAETMIGGTAAGSENLISGNGMHGIAILAGPTSIEGNVIGLNRMGSGAIGNWVGVQISECTTPTRVGGMDKLKRNIISGNVREGIRVTAPGCSQTGGRVQIEGNYIGTNRNGTAAVGNLIGIHVQSSWTVIGNLMPVEKNIISGNLSDGIILDGDHNSVEMNIIGMGREGVPLPNGNNGVLVSGSNNFIGGVGAGNVIAHNGRNGVAVLAGGAVGNKILSNAIHDNALLGIAIDGESAIPNDPLDADTGANDRQNYPDLASAVRNGEQIDVAGSLHSKPGKTYLLEFYANDSCDPSGYGEGENFRKELFVVTPDSGTASFTTALWAVAGSGGGFITATATDPDGNTSGFSECIPVTEAIGIPSEPLGMRFTPSVTPNIFFFGRCEPVQVEIALEIANPPEAVEYVLLFARSMNPTTGEKTAWSDGLSMIPAGKGKYRYTLLSADVPDYDKFPDAVLQYQFVAYNKAQAVIERSEVYGDVALRQCGVVGPAITPARGPRIGP